LRSIAAGAGRASRCCPIFLIGAHAAIRGYSILTRDPAGYRAIFPGVDLIAPGAVVRGAQ